MAGPTAVVAGRDRRPKQGRALAALFLSPLRGLPSSPPHPPRNCVFGDESALDR